MSDNYDSQGFGGDYNSYDSYNSPSDYTDSLVDSQSATDYWNSSAGAAAETQNNLYKSISDVAITYRALRPLMPTTVMPFFTIIKTLGLTNAGVLSVTGILVLGWVDPRLSWDYKNYSTTQLNLVLSNMWYPPLTLLNSASPGSVTPGSATTAQVSYTGLVSVNIPSLFTSTCTLDLSSFPYDIQTCSLYFASLDNNGTSPGILFKIPNSTKLGLNYYSQTGEFALNRGTLTAGKNFCSTYCYSTIVITLELCRRSSYYVMTVIIPAFLLTFLLALALIVPSENSIKISVACTLMVSLYTLQQTVARILPATEKAPLLSLGMLSSLALAASCVFCTITSVIIRMLQPPMGAACVAWLDKVSCLICAQKRNKVSPETIKLDTLKAVIDSTDPASDNEISEQLKDSTSPVHWAILKLLEQQTSTAIRSSREAAEKAARDGDNARRWRTVDSVINIVLISLYIVIALACLLSFDSALNY